jgi:branched-chain amino acid transport system substrate-binding protein
MKLARTLAAAAALIVAAVSAADAQTVKVGFITSYTGQNATVGALMDKALDLYLKEHANALPPGVKVEILRRDDTGPNPEVAKRLATELITRDHVDFLTGVIWTPNAMAIGPLAGEAKTPFLIMNAGTSAITTTSPYVARVSFTLWQSSLPLGQWAAKSNLKRVYVLTSDYGPGNDAAAAFTKGFSDGGGSVAEAVKMPITTQDFAPFMQKVKDTKPDAVFVFVPAGIQATGVIKAYSDLGLPQAGIKLIGPGDITPDEELPNMGDFAVGTITMFHYSAAADRPANKAFVAAWKRAYGADTNPNFNAVQVWDGMQAIFDAIRAQKGKMDGEKTMAFLKGWKFDSPRGPIMIDPETRDIVQNEYLRRLEKVDGKLANVELEVFQTAVKDPWKILNDKR